MSNELDEKFVEKSGGAGVPAAEVADATTGAGGAIQKKKADVKKSVDPKADKVDGATPGQTGTVAEDADADSEVVVEVVEIEESIQAMFEGMDLSEEFTSKVTMVFEAAVNEAATLKAGTIIAEQTEILEAQMAESIESSVDEIVENLDSYLDYVVEEWMKENELAIESIRTEDVPGTHVVKYESDIDFVEIKHEAKNRNGFAFGSVLAAEYIRGKKGVFTMKDVLSF